MLRKLAWAGVNAVAILVARRVAMRVWRVATGEPPPVKPT
jgi:hypothetical protein